MSETEQQVIVTSSSNTSQIVQDKNIADYQEMALDLITKLQFAQILSQINEVHEEYNPDEDFKWFTSGEVDTSSFKGQYIAIWKKQIVGNAESAVEVEMLAKAHCGENCTPAIVYIPEKEDVIF